MTLLQRAIEDSVKTCRGLADLEEPLNRAAQMVLRCLTSGHKVFTCGNGGSASDATHLASEFLCRFVEDRRPYPAISLTADGGFLTAVCNDYSVDEMFARQVRVWPRKATCSSHSRPAANPKTCCGRWKRRNARALKAFVSWVVMAGLPKVWRHWICGAG